MFDRLKLMKETYQEIQNKLIKGNLEVKEMTKLLKEASQLEDSVNTFNSYEELNNELNELNEMIDLESDHEMLEVLKAEVKTIEAKLDELTETLRVLLLPKDPNDDKNVMIEIKGAAGGDEGNLFAGDLFRMYQRYSETNGWKIEVLDTNPGTSGGFASIEFMVSGKKAYSFLKYESGTHRVQRVPETESQGRIHTSTATVLVMPEADEIDFELSWSDIRVDVYRASGAGGQHVNTTDSAVRLTHLPTGIVVACQQERSQIKNRAIAWAMLRARLYDLELKKREEKANAEAAAKTEIGWGHQIRSYVLQPYQLVKDLRTGVESSNPQAVLDGDLDPFIEAALAHRLKEDQQVQAGE